MNKRILFIDDDSSLFDFHALMMPKEGVQWEGVRAKDNGQALEILAAGKIDAVVVDLRQSGMDDGGLMNDMRRLYPRTLRIKIARLDDPGKNANALKCVNQFLNNVTTKELFATLLRVGKLDALLSDEQLHFLVSQQYPLPLATSIHLRILREINSQVPSIAAIAYLIEQDPALTIKLVQVANAVAFGRVNKVGNPFEAVQYLGLNTIRTLVLSGYIFHDFEHADSRKFSAKLLWDAAVRYAQITHFLLQLEIPETLKTKDADITALLDHLGKLMLAKKLPREPEPVTAVPTTANLISTTAERKIPGAAHASVAAYLFGIWGLSTPTVESVVFHLQPPESEVNIVRPPDILPALLISEPASPALFQRATERNLNLPTDINANDRLDPKRTDVQKLFPHDA